MPLSVFIVHAGPARVFCALGLISGLVAFFFGLRRRPRPLSAATPASNETHSTDSSLAPQEPGQAPEPGVSMPQVIRLSLPAVHARSADMTQQQKVAAALLRAGVANPVSWTDSSPSGEPAHAKTASTSVAIAELPPTLVKPSIKPTPHSEIPTNPMIGRKLLLIGGSLLVLLSLYLFLRIH